MVRHLDAAFARIWTLNEEEDVLELEASAGMYTRIDGPHSRVPVGEFKIGLIGQEHQPHLTNDVLGDPHISDKEWAKREGMVAFAGHPLVVEGRLVGVMAMFARKPLEEDTIEALSSVADAVAQGINRKRADEALRRSEASLTEAQRIAHLGNWEWNIKTGEVAWSEEAYRIYGFEPNEFSPTLETVEEVFHPDDRDLFRVTIDEVSHEDESFDFEHRIVRPDGEVRWIHRRGEVVRGEGGEPLRMIGTVQDITEEKALEGRLEYQATHDLLTDLPNRRLFMDRVEQALRHTRRRRRGRKVAVLYMDLDNFKVVNDSLGHEMGDRLLVAVGERLRGCLRPEDTLARFGGDEFTVLVEDVENPEDAVRVAERIIEALREPFVADSRELFLKPSIGIALGEARQKTVEDLLRDADTAMYQAKGRDDHYRVFEPAMYEQALRRLKLESDLRRAIEDEEFVVCYQPIVDLQTEEVWGVEALVRWEHPEWQGLLAPSQFIPVAEEAGLVVPMGRWVLEEACRQGVKWQREHPHVPPLVISVNLSAKQLQHPDMAETVEEILEKTGFEASCLSLDITETVYIEALEGNTAALDKLKKMGVCISIDDFGTGYSSLAYLKRLPAETLKIDKSFIRGIGEDVEDTAIVQMIVELAHTLGMEVIAEGVESEQQAEQLKEMGCDRGQGFYFAEALSREEATTFLSN
jgi:diguanylate cyclase (GGDEF)-like protein/PAS domain S-box-containing protein